MEDKILSAYLTKIFIGNKAILDGILSDIDDEAAEKRINNKTSHVKYILGHIIVVRMQMLEHLAGKENCNIPSSMLELFGNNVNLSELSGKFPSLKELKKYNDEAHHESVNWMNSLVDSDLKRVPPCKPAKKDLEYWIGFYYWHEHYHMGQIGLLRKYFEYARPAVMGLNE